MLYNFLKLNPDNNLPTDLIEIKTTKDEVVKLIELFVEEMIEDPILKEKMHNNLHNPNLIITNSTNIDTLYGKCGSSKKNGKWISETSAYLGKENKDGTISTNILKIRGVVHELAHSISQKFDDNWMNQSGAPLNQPPSEREKDQSIGEIESKFMEKLFNSFIIKNGDLLKQRNCTLGLSYAQLRNEINNLMNNDIYDLKTRLQNPPETKGIDYRKTNEHRYIIGGIFSEILVESCKTAGPQTIQKFYKFLHQNADMSIDDTAEFFTENMQELFSEGITKRFPDKKCKTFSDIVKLFNSICSTKAKQKSSSPDEISQQ